MPEQDLATRVEELEVRYMLLERYLDELSDVVAAQQQTIDVLRATIARLPRTSNAGDTEDATPDERPPHY
jgi:SlyX protein